MTNPVAKTRVRVKRWKTPPIDKVVTRVPRHPALIKWTTRPPNQTTWVGDPAPCDPGPVDWIAWASGLVIRNNAA